MPPDESNELGYFELVSTMKANDELLSDAGGTWDRPPTHDAVAAISDVGRARIGAIVEELAAGAAPAPLVVKDPRVSTLLPAWSDVVGEVLAPVVVIRNPLETAYSLARREDMAVAAGLALWEYTWSSLLNSLNGKTVYIVHYSQLLDDPAVSAGLLQWVTERLPGGSTDRIAATSSLPLRKDLRHNRATAADVAEYATTRQSDLSNWLRQLPGGEITLDVPQHLTHPSIGCLVTLRRDSEIRMKIARLTLAVEYLPELEGKRVAAEASVQEQMARVSYLNERVEAITVERDQRGQLVAELQMELDATRSLAQQARGAMAERDSLRTSAAEALRKLRETTENTEIVKGELEGLRLHDAALAAEIESLKTSESWRIGTMLVRPIARLLGREVGP